MTSMVGENWEVTPHHVWAALGWVIAAAVLGCAIWSGSERLAWGGIFALGVVVTYNVCASIRACGRMQIEAFEMGRDYERRSGVARLR